MGTRLSLPVHVAGGEVRPEGSWQGRWADTHSQPVPDSVWRLVEYVVARGPVKGILVERDQNYPPFSELLDELRTARQILGAAAPVSFASHAVSARPAVAER